MDRRRELIDYLAQGLQHPDVSGFELLELLDMRSRIAMQEPLLNWGERAQLEEIDRRFLQLSKVLLARISQVASLPEMRQRNRVLPSHWWWYLDELIAQPRQTVQRERPAREVAAMAVPT
jgi:hypothetical protein